MKDTPSQVAMRAVLTVLPEATVAMSFPADYRLTGTRVEQLRQLGNAVCPLQAREIVATTPGDMRLEHDLHKRFASARSHGEWFRPEPELLAFIRGIST